MNLQFRYTIIAIFKYILIESSHDYSQDLPAIMNASSDIDAAEIHCGSEVANVSTPDSTHFQHIISTYLSIITFPIIMASRLLMPLFVNGSCIITSRSVFVQVWMFYITIYIMN